MFISLAINEACNFGCPECFTGAGFKVSAEESRHHRPRPKELAAALDAFAPSVVYISGGEPLLYPEFARCCEALAAKHLVGILSNLSCDNVVADIVRLVRAKDVFAIGGSLHIHELERLNAAERFFHSLEMVVAADIPVFTVYNLGKRLEPRFDYYVGRVKNYGIPIFAKYVQRGCGAKPTDDSYKAVEAAGLNMSWFNPYDIGRAVYPLMQCGAGRVSVNISALDGTVRKCVYDPTPMGNIFDGKFNPSISDFCRPHCFCHTYLFTPGFSDCYDGWDEFQRVVQPNTVKVGFDI